MDPRARAMMEQGAGRVGMPGRGPPQRTLAVYVTGGGMGGTPPLPIVAPEGMTWEQFLAAVTEKFGVPVGKVQRPDGSAVTSMDGARDGELWAVVPGKFEGSFVACVAARGCVCLR